MLYKILDLSPKKEWNKYLYKLPINQQDIYFTPEYYELYEKNGDGKAQCFVFEEKGEIALYPFLINSINKLGYKLDEEYYDIQGAYGYNGVIASSYDEEFIKSFSEYFTKYCNQNNIIAEFTRFHPIIGNVKFSYNYMNVIYDRKTVYLEMVDDYKHIWEKEYTSKNRNMIRKGRKSLFSVIGQEVRELVEFKKVYLYTMKKIEAINYYNFNDEYFENLHFKNNIVINIYDKESKNLQCSMILMICENYAHYHLSGRSENCTNNSANNFMLDEAVKYAINKGCKYFHFGGGISNLETDTLFKFKASFSKSKADFYIGKKINNVTIYQVVVNQWKQKYPLSYENNKNKVLGYRDIPKI